MQFTQAYDKEYSISSNYFKGHGDFNLSWILEFYPGITLFHVDSTHGTRKEILFTSSLAMVMKPYINLEFLDYCLSIPKEDIHMLQKNMFVLLSSVEMVGQCRLLEIVYISCMMPLCWIHGNMNNIGD